MTDLAWFALQVRPRFEKTIADQIGQKGFDSYLPVTRCTRKSRLRERSGGTPLFSGYVFCRLNLKNRMPIITIPGVTSIIGVGKQPEPIPDEEIQNIRTVVESRLPVKCTAFFDVGQLIQLGDGPLRGVEGRVLGFRDDLRLIVSISLLQRSVEVAVRPEWIVLKETSPAVRQADSCRQGSYDNDRW